MRKSERLVLGTPDDEEEVDMVLVAEAGGVGGMRTGRAGELVCARRSAAAAAVAEVAEGERTTSGRSGGVEVPLTMAAGGAPLSSAALSVRSNSPE